MFGSRTTVKKVRNSLTWFSHFFDCSATVGFFFIRVCAVAPGGPVKKHRVLLWTSQYGLWCTFGQQGPATAAWPPSTDAWRAACAALCWRSVLRPPQLPARQINSRVYKGTNFPSTTLGPNRKERDQLPFHWPLKARWFEPRQLEPRLRIKNVRKHRISAKTGRLRGRKGRWWPTRTSNGTRGVDHAKLDWHSPQKQKKVRLFVTHEQQCFVIESFFKIRTFIGASILPSSRKRPSTATALCSDANMLLHLSVLGMLVDTGRAVSSTHETHSN